MSEPSTSTDARFRGGPVVTLAGAHFIHDIFTAFLAPLLPLIIIKLNLSLLQAGSLAVLSQLPSLLNPLIGSVTDRGGFAKLVVVVSPGITGVLMCTIGLAPTYGVLAIILLTSGLSIAAVHVAAPSVVSASAGNRMGLGMGFFMLGGELARTLGPLVVVQAVSIFTLEGIWKLAPVSVASSLVLYPLLSKAPTIPRTEGPAGPAAAFSAVYRLWRDMRKLLLLVAGLLLARAFMAAAAITFLPTLLYSEGSTLWVANVALSVLELAGAAGAILSGSLSDKLGRRTILIWATVISPLMMMAFLAADGFLVYPALLGLGFTTLATTPVMLALIIERSGASKATAGGTFMMLSFVIRSLVVLLVGGMGDLMGLREAYFVCALLGLLGIPFALLMPRKD